jgi:hypothetical protein
MGNSVAVLWLEDVNPLGLSEVSALKKLGKNGVDVRISPLPLIEKQVSYYQILTGCGSGRFGRFDAVYPVEYVPREENDISDEASPLLLPNILRGRRLSVEFWESSDVNTLASIRDQSCDCIIVRLLQDKMHSDSLASIVERFLEYVPDSANKVVLTDVWEDPAARLVNPNDFLADIGLLEVGHPRSRATVNWSESLAYTLGNGQIWINLRGREAEGIVSSGEEFEEVQAALIHQLLTNWRDAETNEPVVQTVLRKEEAYSGDFLFKAPDLIMQLRPGYTVSEKAKLLEFDGMSVSRTPSPPSAKTTPIARLIASGPELGKGILEQGNTIDIAPTLFYLLNQPIPQHVEGRVLTSLFQPEYLQQTEIRYSDESEESLSGDEEEMIVDRLRDLGYLG